MANTFEGKVALVTGGNVGIGRATAIAFAREGAAVVIAARRVEEGEDTVKYIESQGGKALFVQTDVVQTAEVKALIETTVRTFGKLDCAFNNAGTEGTFGVPTADYEEEVFDRVVTLNMKGTWLCMKYEIQQMLSQGGGAIVNNSSVSGLVGTRVGIAYIGSKHGVVGLTKAAALEYASQGIRVNAVCPAMVHTDMSRNMFGGNPEREAAVAAKHPVGRFGNPEEIAETTLWLCSDAASFVTGHAMAVDGGWCAE